MSENSHLLFVYLVHTQLKTKIREAILVAVSSLESRVNDNKVTQ